MYSEEIDNIIFWLIAWIAIILSMGLQNYHKEQPVLGFSLAYILQLTLIHWFGALIYTLPWFHSDFGELQIVSKGFAYSAVGVCGIWLGHMLVTKLMHVREAHETEYPLSDSSSLANTYIIIALTFYLLIWPFLRNVPSITSIGIATLLLIIPAFMLKWYYYYKIKRFSALIILVALFCMVLAIVLILTGNSNIVVNFSFIVIMFVGALVTRNFLKLFTYVLLAVLGISFYISYMNNRHDLRQLVWHQQEYVGASEKLLDIISEAEVIDLKDVSNLESINMRINQNYLVGSAIAYLEGGAKDFANGKTVGEAFMYLIPRIVWPDKPYVAGSGSYVSDYTGIEFARGTSVGMGQIFEFYINFGLYGVFIGCLIMGILISYCDRRAVYYLRRSDYGGFAFWVMPAVGLMKPGGSLAEVTTSTVACLIVIFVVNLLFKRSHNILEQQENQGTKSV